MKILITYSSLTGNTKKVAEAIHEEIGGDLKPMSEASNWEDYDFIAMGFYVDKGWAAKDAKAYIDNVKNKKVGLFATMGAEPESDHGKSVLETGRALMKKNGNELICEFLCQGAIDPEIIVVMRKMAQRPDARHPITPEREKRWKDAESHPDANDLENAKKAFEKIKG